MPAIAQRYQQCSPAVGNSFETCGTITRTNLKSLAPADLLTVFQDGSGNYRDMASILKATFEMKQCGIKRNGLFDFLMSSARGASKLVNQKKIPGSESFIEPYILARQKSVINSDYWAITTGFATGSYTPTTTGPLTSVSGGTRVIRVLSRHGLDVGTEWFRPRHKVHVFGRTAGGSATRSQWQIVDAAVDAGVTYVDILLADENAGSTTISDLTPIAGFLVIGANDVGDWESWCHNRAALNPNKLIPFFFQTSRSAMCVDSHYKEYLKRTMDINPLFREFGDVSLAERNKQVGETFQKEWVNSFFWNKPLVNQTIANYTSLDTIQSVSGTTMGYRANATGVYEQLKACGQVKDLQEQKLNLRELFLDLYNLMRARENSGIPNKSIDIFMDSDFAEKFKRGMIEYYDTQSSGKLAYRAPISEGNIGEDAINLGFWADSYKLDYPAGLVINVVTHPFFDDIANAAATESAALRHTGRFLWIIDFGSIYPGIIGSSRVTTTVDQIELLRKVNTSYSCVISNPTRDLTLNSMTWTAIVECPAASLVYENFNGDVVPDGAALDFPYDGYTYP